MVVAPEGEWKLNVVAASSSLRKPFFRETGAVLSFVLRYLQLVLL